MCLTTNDTEIKTAANDIIVFKKGDIRCPLFQRFRSLCVNWDFSYKRLRINKPVQLEVEAGGSTSSVEAGYHGYRKWNRQIFIVPKGTKYVDGYNNNNMDAPSVVAENIIWIGYSFNPLNWLLVLAMRNRWEKPKSPVTITA